MKTITIIGGGASGTLLALNLLQKCGEEPLHINLIEKRSAFGRGVAYSTQHDVHLLNVPVAKMGAYPKNVAHFHAWLNSQGHSFAPDAFVPRRLFGDYLFFLLDTTRKHLRPNASITVFDSEAVAVESANGVNDVILESGERLSSENVVLAFGNFLQPNPAVESDDYTSAPKYFRNAWAAEVYQKIDPEDTVLIIGTGLSMVDVIMRLRQISHRGKIRAISTRGLLPETHELGHHYDSFYDELKGLTRITDIMKVVRRHIKAAESNAGNWRAVIDSLRPHTQTIWRDLPISEKRYFMQHLSRYWNAARHRVPPEGSAVLDALRETGQLEILAGRLRRIKQSVFEDFEVIYYSDGAEKLVHAHAIINCIGSECNFEKVDSPLVRDLLQKGIVRKDELALGLDSTPDGRIIGSDSIPSETFFTLGTALKGVLWESTAIPEIRVQAAELAGLLLDKQDRRSPSNASTPI